MVRTRWVQRLRRLGLTASAAGLLIAGTQLSAYAGPTPEPGDHSPGVTAAVSDPAISGYAIARSCATPARAGSLEVSVRTNPVQALDYRLTHEATVVAAGVIDAAASTRFTIANVPAGPVSLEFFTPGESVVRATFTTRVLSCVIPVVACKSVTFTNPASNLPLVGFFKAADGQGPSTGLELEPGQSQTVRTDLARAMYYLTFDDEQTTILPATDPDSNPIVIPQDCSGPTPVPGDGSLSSYGSVGCAGSKPARVDVHVRVSAGLRAHFQIRNTQNMVVASGRVPKSEDVAVTIKRAGRYTYLSFIDGVAAPFETRGFTVERCLTTKISCHHVTFRNPNAENVSVAYWRRSNQVTFLSLDPHSSVRIRWTAKKISYTTTVAPADPDDDGSFASSAGAVKNRKTHRC